MVVTFFVILFFGSRLLVWCPSLCDLARLPHPRISHNATLASTRMNRGESTTYRILAMCSVLGIDNCNDKTKNRTVMHECGLCISIQVVKQLKHKVSTFKKDAIDMSSSVEKNHDSLDKSSSLNGKIPSDNSGDPRPLGDRNSCIPTIQW